MRFHVQLLNPYPPGIIKTKHWRFNVQYLNPHPPHVMSCDQRPTPGGWHVAWCGKEIGPQHPKVEVEAAILASKRLRSGFEAARMSGIIIPDMRMSGIIIPDMRAASKPLRSRFEARMAASTSTFGCWGPISFPHQATCQPPGVGRWSHDITCGGWGFKYWTLNLQCLVLIMPGG